MAVRRLDRLAGYCFSMQSKMSLFHYQIGCGGFPEGKILTQAGDVLSYPIVIPPWLLYPIQGGEQLGHLVHGGKEDKTHIS